ncbi:hypothetical protein GQ43DRAFT_499551 [Delitschia confertaspora ATCC 74209]|uniref:Uncharacterized protein n=1 Tax=Delitschia confertaspora ATCC 74209 TaxID=1513339 RepID=A0A9P4JD86_9PLEO|nr:hypothetical protein GQ43DRAFT_499551 [Delitschia confertaspora ATCC 74209]
MYLPVGRTLIRISEQRNIFSLGSYPAPLFPMRFNYVARPELLDTRHMKKIQEEDKLICQLVQDFILQNIFKQTQKDYIFKNPTDLAVNLLPSFNDIFPDSLQSVWKIGEVTMRNVFASGVLLDIHEICPGFDGRKLLHEEGRCQDELFEFYIDNKGSLHTRSGIRWLQKENQLVMEIWQRVYLQIIDSKFAISSRYLYNNFPNPTTMIYPARITEEDLKKITSECLIHSVLSGSLKPSRDKGTAFAVAHLYNAQRKMELTDIAWSHMERIIKVHTGPLFANEIPSTPQEMQAHMFFRLGMDRSLTRFGTDKKSQAKNDIAISPAISLLLQFFRTKQPLEKTVYQLEDFANAAISETQIPHLGLTKVSVHLLEAIGERLKASGYKLQSIRINPDDSKNYGLIFIVAEMLLENSTMKKKDPGRKLQLAAIELKTCGIT